MTKNDSSKSVEKLRLHLESNNFKYLIPSYVDMHGVPKTKMVPIAHLENLYYKTDAERAAQGVTWLPRTLSEAVDAFEKDPLGRAVFGDLMFDTWIEFKRAEWLSYLNHVSDWERDRYLKFF